MSKCQCRVKRSLVAQLSFFCQDPPTFVTQVCLSIIFSNCKTHLGRNLTLNNVYQSKKCIWLLWCECCLILKIWLSDAGGCGQRIPLLVMSGILCTGRHFTYFTYLLVTPLLKCFWKSTYMSVKVYMLYFSLHISWFKMANITSSYLCVNLSPLSLL